MRITDDANITIKIDIMGHKSVSALAHIVGHLTKAMIDVLKYIDGIDFDMAIAIEE